jgi:hypothetical protein
MTMAMKTTTSHCQASRQFARDELQNDAAPLAEVLEKSNATPIIIFYEEIDQASK